MVIQVGDKIKPEDDRERKAMTDDEVGLITRFNWALKIGDSGSSGEKQLVKLIRTIIESGMTTAAIGRFDPNYARRVWNLLDNKELLNALAREYWWGEGHIDLENGEILLSKKCYGLSGSYEGDEE
jgi:ABC-type ATPase involved in cell division|tara:strand:- start:1225 stop:1602 length:378 start_codon:yes stop_codon:yes gene_type:complete